mgnify:CR=1 FL=1|tara:strand:+ start:193 stop:567 length:375 start_codon:yes stop_codon:yes gene_type:complete
MSVENTNAETSAVLTEQEDLKPKPPPKLAPRGIRTFTMCRQSDETGISGTGVVVEGCLMATGQVIVHWLSPVPRGSIAIFDSMNDFVMVHVSSHLTNGTIITFEDGEQIVYKRDGTKENILAPE